jgi:hypothetical protein
MRLDLRDLAVLPLAAATFDWDGGPPIVTTPEWRGDLGGSVTYALERRPADQGHRVKRLVIEQAAGPPHAAVALERLLTEMSMAAAQAQGEWALRIGMQIDGLRLVTGRCSSDEGTTADVLGYIEAGLPVRRTEPIEIARVMPDGVYPIASPAAVGLAVIQLVLNAGRHAGVSEVTLRVTEGPTFSVEWEGRPPGSRVLRTSRRQRQAPRTGLAYDKLVADALGGQLSGVMPCGAAGSRILLAFGAGYLTLPMARVTGGQVLDATATWYDETGIPVHAAVPHDLVALVAEAEAQRGRIVVIGDLCARSLGASTLIAQPPDDLLDRMRFALRLLEHEAVLFEAPEPYSTKVQALVAALDGIVGDAWPKTERREWNAKIGEACAALGAHLRPPELEAPNGLDHCLSAYLIANYADGFWTDGDDLWMDVRDDRRDQFIDLFLDDASGAVNLVRPPLARTLPSIGASTRRRSVLPGDPHR